MCSFISSLLRRKHMASPASANVFRAVLLNIYRELSSEGAPMEQANADGAEDERASRLIEGAM